MIMKKIHVKKALKITIAAALAVALTLCIPITGLAEENTEIVNPEPENDEPQTEVTETEITEPETEEAKQTEAPEYTFSNSSAELAGDRASANDVTVRIKLSTGGVSSLSIKLSAGYNGQVNGAGSFSIAAGTYTISASGSTVSLSGNGVNYSGSSITLISNNISDTIRQLRSNGTNYYYRGKMIYTADASKVVAVNYIDIENYLYGVVGYEMSNSWPLEALKAQAVVARGYIMRSLHPSRSYDVSDTASDQVYYGYTSSDKNVIAAVNATKGQYLTYNGKVCYTYFADSNGGQTELAGNAWGGGDTDNKKHPYLIIKDDAYDLESNTSLVQVLKIPSDPSSLLNKNMVKGGNQLKSNCNIRSGPGSNYAIIGHGLKNAHYILLGEVGSWYQLEYPLLDGSTTVGYLSKEFGEVVTNPSGLFVYANPAITEMQKAAYDCFVDSLHCTVYNNTYTSIRIDSVNSITNTTKRWQGTDSRSYVTASANITVSDVKNANGDINGPVTINVNITLMNKNDANTGYVIAHDYLCSSLRLRGVEATNGGWNIVCRRYGHGVGLSQQGARWMALQYSKKYREILSFYYPGTVLVGSDPLPPEYSFSSDTVTGIATGTDVQTFLANISLIKENVSNSTLTDGEGTSKTAGTVSTGDVLTISFSGGSTEQYTVVIYGDLNCDGKIELADLLSLQKAILGAKTLSGASLLAADISKEGTVDILDLLKLKKHLLGTSPITQ